MCIRDRVNYGNFSSGKKETKKKEEIFHDREFEKGPEIENNDGNSTRAKANDGDERDNRKDRNDNSNDKRGKKPKADDR